ncbi:hypothetical protein PSI19_03120 [Xenorhabdus khoisanae]|uniref:hypothetical protein n=1 Tax=Xenorhabdus khoisanae TaxID=880157 RepID=UPI002358852C|nr:hypothetical protein [Xenorhabdus khoisanae]MDC9612888.1 hypothetical protein [Xenorhabdus khoisanae]
MTESESQRLLEIVQLADERYGVHNGSRKKVDFVLGLTRKESTKVHYHAVMDLPLSRDPSLIRFCFNILRERVGLDWIGS